MRIVYAYTAPELPSGPDFVKIFTSSEGRGRKVAVTRENARRGLLTARKGPVYNGALVASPPDRRPPDDGWGGYGQAWSIIGTLLAGPAVWGAIGFGLDRLFGFTALFLSIGVVVGAVGSVYLVVIRYGRSKS